MQPFAQPKLGKKQGKSSGKRKNTKNLQQRQFTRIIPGVDVKRHKRIHKKQADDGNQANKYHLAATGIQ
ncbi:hypothetical protein D3C87_1688250 [compost metagenome]